MIRKGFHKDVDSYSAFTEADGKTTTGLAAYLKAREIKRLFVAATGMNTGVSITLCGVVSCPIRPPAGSVLRTLKVKLTRPVYRRR